MHRVEDKWLHFIVSSSMNDQIVLVPDHPSVAPGHWRSSRCLGLVYHNRWVSQFHDEHFTEKTSFWILSPKNIDPFLTDWRILFNNCFIIIDAISFSFMEDRDGLMLCKPTFELIRHFMNRQLVPIVFLVIIVHEVAEQFARFIGSTWND